MKHSIKITLFALFLIAQVIPGVSMAGSIISNYKVNIINKDTSRAKVYIEGMSCMRCAQKIEKKVSALEGVKKINVFLEEKYAIIVFENKTTTIEAITEKIEETGYEVKEYKIIKNKKD